MGANLTNPFGESCCDGGAISCQRSAQPCGCDEGAHHKCDYHIIETLKGALEDITTADETSTLEGAVAIAQHALKKCGF